MSADSYRDRLKQAAWGWMEGRRWWKRGENKARKDRRDGRAEKRGARQEERAEIATDEPTEMERRYGHE